MKRKIFFRVDGNQTIGRGHVSRCLAVAEMLKHDFDIVIISLKVNEKYMMDLISDFKFVTIENDKEIESLLTKVDLLWLDGYEFSERWKKEIRDSVYKLIETNDIPYEAKNVDILINHTPGVKKTDFGTVENTDLLLGLEFALLRPQFLEFARQNSQVTPNNKGVGVFVCFGGVDTFNLGEAFVKALLKAQFKDPIYWIKSNTNSDPVFDPQVIELSNLSGAEMIRYMTIAKVLLIPSSVLSFEAIALRKPIFTCYFVDNQKLIYQGLIKDDLADGVGYVETSNDVKKATGVFLQYYKNDNLQKRRVLKQLELLDGFSDSRIKEVVLNKKI